MFFNSRTSKSEDIDIISRKEYVVLTGAKLSILKGTESGAGEKDDGEMHIEIRGAHDLSLSTGILKFVLLIVLCVEKMWKKT